MGMLWIRKRWNAEQYMVFSQQMGHLLESGIPLLACLELLAAQRLIDEPVYQRLNGLLQKGQSLSAALKKLNFPPIYIAFVRAAEEHGDYVSGFKRCASYYATKANWQREVKKACTYPAIVFLLAVCVFVFMFAVVMPRFSHLYASMNISMPLVTRRLFRVYDAMPQLLAGGMLLILLVVAVGFILRLSPFPVRVWWGACWIRLPLVRQICRYRHTHFLTIQLSSLLKAGVSLVDALQLIQKHTPWPVLVHYLNRVNKELLTGKSFAGALSQKGKYFFLPSLPRLVAIAEESGKLVETLTNLADGTEMMIRYKLERVAKSIEPVCIFVIGLMIAVSVVALFLPVVKLVQAL